MQATKEDVVDDMLILETDDSLSGSANEKVHSPPSIAQVVQEAMMKARSSSVLPEEMGLEPSVASPPIGAVSMVDIQSINSLCKQLSSLSSSLASSFGVTGDKRSGLMPSGVMKPISSSWKTLLGNGSNLTQKMPLSFVSLKMQNGVCIASVDSKEVNSLSGVWSRALALFIIRVSPSLDSVTRFISVAWKNTIKPKIQYHNDR